MEPRAGICSYDKASGKYTLTVPGQGRGARRGSSPTSGVTPDKVRILSYNVGGSFGMKAPIYPEYVCLAHATRELGRPVKGPTSARPVPLRPPRPRPRDHGRARAQRAG